jgi:hypothetical protein
MRSFLRLAAAALCLAVGGAWSATPLTAQGVTTAAVRGRVLDDTGMPVVGATVVLTNTSTGQRFQGTSRAGGLYNLENVAVGGPYTIEARSIGYQPARRSGIILTLGQVLDLERRASRAAVELEVITVTAEEGDDLFTPDKQGTEITVGDTAKDWGRIKTVDGGVFSNPQILTVPSGAGGRANYQFDVSRVTERFRASTAAYNSWQMQVALRYTF